MAVEGTGGTMRQRAGMMEHDAAVVSISRGGGGGDRQTGGESESNAEERRCVAATVVTLPLCIGVHHIRLNVSAIKNRSFQKKSEVVMFCSFLKLIYTHFARISRFNSTYIDAAVQCFNAQVQQVIYDQA
jgi:hypothetical protein